MTAEGCERRMLITTDQLVMQWGAVFGGEVLAAAILDRLCITVTRR